MNTLEGKVTLITGAKGGLGAFITEAFLAAGAKVVGVSRSIQASDFRTPVVRRPAGGPCERRGGAQGGRRHRGPVRTY